MDGLTLFAAALIGGSVATVGTALVAVVMRLARSRVRRREPGPRPIPASRPGPARPAAPRPAPPPPGRPKDARANDARAKDARAKDARAKDTRSRVPKPPPGAYPRPVPPTEALGGETLQLGPVPAWKLPARPPGAGAPPPADAPRNDHEPRNDRDPYDGRGAPSVVANASRRHDPRTAVGRTPAR